MCQCEKGNEGGEKGSTLLCWGVTTRIRDDHTFFQGLGEVNSIGGGPGAGRNLISSKRRRQGGLVWEGVG